MGDEDLSRWLKQAHAAIVATKRDASGRIVHLVQLPSGEQCAMSHADVLDLATGAVPLHEILARDSSADHSGPWPPPEYAGDPGTHVEFRGGREVRQPAASATTPSPGWDTSLDLIASMIGDYRALGEKDTDKQVKPQHPPSVVRRVRRT